MRQKLGIPMSLGEIANATSGSLLVDGDSIITHISIDTRELFRGDLFIAIKGKKYNGENYLKEAKKRGAYTLSSSVFADIKHHDGITALLSLARFYAQNLPYLLYKIAITGSVGKTTTKEFTKLLLKQKYKVHASEGNFNNEIGMPMSILSAKKDTQILLMEMGMNHLGEISRLSKCLMPNVALITNVGTAHIGNLGSRENIAKAKREINDGMTDGIVIVPYGEVLLNDLPKKRTFSIADISADYYLLRGEEGLINIFNKGDDYCKAKFALIEEHHVLCLAAAVSIAINLQLSPAELESGISLISYDNTRQSLVFKEDRYFFADFYNASAESVIAMIKSAENMVTSGRKHLLLGDILELGEMSERIHFDVGSKIDLNMFDKLFLFGEKIHHLAEGAINIGFPSDRIFINQNLSAPEATADQIRRNTKEGDRIFMKASRAIGLERVLDCLN